MKTSVIVPWAVTVVLLVGCGGFRVDRLSLRDPRLPMEARSWLADAEDEVAISRARVDAAQRELDSLERYGEVVDAAVKAPDFRKNGGEAVGEQFEQYLSDRRDLRVLELDTALAQLELSKMRLVQARAETAVRYDIAVYELEEIAREVERLRLEVAASQKKVEEKRVAVEKAADKVWQSYGEFVRKGGVPNTLWSVREAKK